MVSLQRIVALKVIVERGRGFVGSIVTCTIVGYARTTGINTETIRNGTVMSKTLFTRI
jgi:hypothetical protein